MLHFTLRVERRRVGVVVHLVLRRERLDLSERAAGGRHRGLHARCRRFRRRRRPSRRRLPRRRRPRRPRRPRSPSAGPSRGRRRTWCPAASAPARAAAVSFAFFATLPHSIRRGRAAAGWHPPAVRPVVSSRSGIARSRSVARNWPNSVPVMFFATTAVVSAPLADVFHCANSRSSVSRRTLIVRPRLSKRALKTSSSLRGRRAAPPLGESHEPEVARLDRPFEPVDVLRRRVRVHRQRRVVPAAGRGTTPASPDTRVSALAILQLRLRGGGTRPAAACRARRRPRAPRAASRLTRLSEHRQCGVGGPELAGGGRRDSLRGGLAGVLRDERRDVIDLLEREARQEVLGAEGLPRPGRSR